MSFEYRVVYRTQKVQVNDPSYGQFVDKVVQFPTFLTAVNFARTVRSDELERVLGKPCVERVR